MASNVLEVIKLSLLLFMKKLIPQKVFVITFILATFGIPAAEAGRGCCSWHGGQNYCDTNSGRWVCNDGTYSPTCGCSYIPPKPKYNTCSVDGLYEQYKFHKAKGEEMTDLAA